MKYLLFSVFAFCFIDANSQQVSAKESDTYIAPVSQIAGYSNTDLLVVVQDALGNEMYSKIKVYEDKGFLFSTASDGNILSSGVYLITASADDTVFRQTLIVQ